MQNKIKIYEGTIDRNCAYCNYYRECKICTDLDSKETFYSCKSCLLRVWNFDLDNPEEYE